MQIAQAPIPSLGDVLCLHVKSLDVAGIAPGVREPSPLSGALNRIWTKRSLALFEFTCRRVLATLHNRFCPLSWYGIVILRGRDDAHIDRERFSHCRKLRGRMDDRLSSRTEDPYGFKRNLQGSALCNGLDSLGLCE